MYQPRFRALLAELYGHVGQTEAGLTGLTEVLADVHNTGLCYCEAELYRLKGVLHLQHSAEHQEAEESFQQALVIARHQEAKSLELRTAVSLSRLLASHGKRAEACVAGANLRLVHRGVCTADLQAKALLDALA